MEGSPQHKYKPFSICLKRENKEEMSGKALQSVLDSGASHHMNFNRDIFSIFSKLPAPMYVTILIGQQVHRGVVANQNRSHGD